MPPDFPDLSKESDERKKDELIYTYGEKIKIVQRKNNQYGDDLFKIYPMIIERLSPESLAKVEKAYPEFHSMIRDKLDAGALWKLVKKVHAVGDSAVIIFNVILALKTYVGIAQNPKESLVCYVMRHIAYYCVIIIIIVSLS